MPATAQILPDTGELKITIQGNFDFAMHNNFRHFYEDLDKPAPGYIIDLGQTTYLDSCALGMLLLLRDFAGGDKAKIKIINVKDDVKELLVISSFNKLFDIS